VGSFVVDGASAKALVGSCPTARDVRVDETIVGQIGSSSIVDAKGGHCYEVVTNGFPGVRLEGRRLYVYERPIDLFLASEIPLEKTGLRRCAAAFASLMPSPTTNAGPVFTSAPASLKPPKTKPPPKPPRKPRK
jgi:hypothetical protein